MSDKTSDLILSDRFSEAVVFAECLHRHQMRKGTQIPYISHLMSVAALVLEDGGNETEAIAALLHDAVEDQGGLDTLANIRQQFGDKVAEIVLALSDTVVIPKPPWRQRKDAYLKKLADDPDAVMRVAIADKLHNTRCQLQDYQRLGEPFWDRFNASKAETLWFLESFLAVCHRRVWTSPNLTALDAVVQQLSTLSHHR